MGSYPIILTVGARSASLQGAVDTMGCGKPITDTLCGAWPGISPHRRAARATLRWAWIRPVAGTLRLPAAREKLREVTAKVRENPEEFADVSDMETFCQCAVEWSLTWHGQAGDGPQEMVP